MLLILIYKIGYMGSHRLLPYDINNYINMCIWLSCLVSDKVVPVI